MARIVLEKPYVVIYYTHLGEAIFWALGEIKDFNFLIGVLTNEGAKFSSIDITSEFNVQE